MTKPHFFDLAKQGDPQAIADAFNYFLSADNITTKVQLKNSLLEVIVEASGIPNQQQSVKVIRQVMDRLKIEFINQIKVYGKQTGVAKLAWYEELKPETTALPFESKTSERSESAKSPKNPVSEKPSRTPEYCRDKARKELTLMMGGGAAVGAIPVPGAFTTGTTAVQIAVVTRLAKIYGFSLEAAGGAAAVAGAIMVFGGASTISKIAGEAATFIPVVGWIAKPAIAAATTKAFGEAAIAYFESHYPDKIYNLSD